MPPMPLSEDAQTAVIIYWLTRPEVAERIRVPEKTLAQWASQGKGPKYARFGRHCRYRLSDLIAWENAQFGGAA